MFGPRSRPSIPIDERHVYAMAALRLLYRDGQWDKVLPIYSFLDRSATEVDMIIAKLYGSNVPIALKPEKLVEAFERAKHKSDIDTELVRDSKWIIYDRHVGRLPTRATPRMTKIGWVQTQKANQYSKLLESAPPAETNTSVFDIVLMSLTFLKVGLRRMDEFAIDDGTWTGVQRAARIFLEKPFVSQTKSSRKIEMRERRNKVVQAFFSGQDPAAKEPPNIVDLLDEIGRLYPSIHYHTIRQVACLMCGKIRDDKGKPQEGQSQARSEPPRVVIKSPNQAKKIARECRLIIESEPMTISVEISTAFHPDADKYKSQDCPCGEEINQGRMPLYSWDHVGGYLPPFLFFRPGLDVLWSDESFHQCMDVLYCREENGELKQVEESYQLCQVFYGEDADWILYARAEDSDWMLFDPKADVRMKKLEDYNVDKVWQEVCQKREENGMIGGCDDVLLVFAHKEYAVGYIDR